MDLIRTFLQHVKPEDTILDIGANFGGYTHMFRLNCPWATVHAFEPIPSVYAELKARYNAEPNTHCWNLGVGAKREVVRGVAVHEAWTINRPGETKRGRNATFGQDTFDMQVTTVDSFLLGWPQAGGRVTAIKIDTDGYDFRVLRGAAETITRCRPRILIEFGYCITDIDGINAVDSMMEWIVAGEYGIYDATGNRLRANEFKCWYPWKTTADFLLVPSEQELNPVE